MAELEHIGIAVGDLKHTLRVLEDVLQVTPFKSEAIEKDRIRTHFLRAGGAKLELLESLGDDSPVARFLEKRGPGIHHLAFEVGDIDAAHRRLTEAGYPPLDEAPRAGADGKRIFFLHPKDTSGILLEFCQSARSTLVDAGAVGPLHIRRSPGRTGPAVSYLHPRDAHPEPDGVARRLEQSFSFHAVEAPEDVDESVLRNGLGDLQGLVACGVRIPPALRYAADVGLKALVLIDPPDRLWRVELDCAILVVGQDGHNVEAALNARSSLPGSKLALVPDGDPEIVLRIVELHLMKELQTA